MSNKRLKAIDRQRRRFFKRFRERHTAHYAATVNASAPPVASVAKARTMGELIDVLSRPRRS